MDKNIMLTVVISISVSVLLSVLILAILVAILKVNYTCLLCVERCVRVTVLEIINNEWYSVWETVKPY